MSTFTAAQADRIAESIYGTNPDYCIGRDGQKIKWSELTIAQQERFLECACAIINVLDRPDTYTIGQSQED